MSKYQFFIIFVLVNIFSCLPVFGQAKNKILKTSGNNIPQNIEKKCDIFINGKILSNPKPVYPIEAKSANVSGKVDVVVEIDEKGNVTEIESVNGNELLKNAAAEAAKLAKFSPPMCDGVPSKTNGVITYNFAPVSLTANYFKPASLEDFTDVSSQDNYYEAVLFLTENYKIAFGYTDGKYHAEMPLTKGDFCNFLRQTLELIDSRAKFSKKDLTETIIYKNYNPNNLKEIEFNPTEPFANSITTLSEKYGIILADKNGNFDGNSSFNQQEIIEIWQNIFGDEAIPVNFKDDKAKEKAMSRGDFAIFLNESLEYLIYKTLP